jgi:hypothetical protein
MGRQLEPLSAGGLDRLQRPFAAVGQRYEPDLVGRSGASPAVGQGAGNGDPLNESGAIRRRNCVVYPIRGVEDAIGGADGQRNGSIWYRLLMD